MSLMWIYFPIAFKPLFCSRSPRGICHLCLLCKLLGVRCSNLQSDLHLYPFGLFVFFGLKFGHNTFQNNILQSSLFALVLSSSQGLWVVARTLKRTTFQCWFAWFPGWKNLILCVKWEENEKPTIPTNNNKWQEARCGLECVCSCVTDRNLQCERLKI